MPLRACEDGSSMVLTTVEKVRDSRPPPFGDTTHSMGIEHVTRFSPRRKLGLVTMSSSGAAGLRHLRVSKMALLQDLLRLHIASACDTGNIKILDIGYCLLKSGST